MSAGGPLPDFARGPEGYLEQPDAAELVLRPKRTDHQVLVSIAQLLEETLAELRHLRADMAERAGSKSSVEIKSSPITVKSYVGSDVRAAGDAAIDEFARLTDELPKRLSIERSR